MPPLQPPAPFVIERLVRLALEEDAGRGDVTTAACVPPSLIGAATLRARAALVLCGVPLVREVYRQVDPRVQVRAIAEDGARLDAGDDAVALSGPAAALLLGERVALNFAQRLSGIATTTRRFVDALPEGSRTRIADTRKTTPLLRALERYAVRAGGAHNHREDLSSAVLIKDNHVAAAGGIEQAIARARAYAPHTSRIECEVDTEAQLAVALGAGADVILLDNFDDAAVRRAVATTAGRAILEASGNVTLERVRSLAEAPPSRR